MAEKTYHYAAYMRLSREDGDGGESNSITNQRAIIKGFVQSRGVTIEKEYIDDGYTGMNFDRPGFKELLEDIKNNVVNTVVVKDLSRFGRNFTEVGRYLEQLFPVWGVRFIAIHDLHDSAKNDAAADTLTIAFKNLLNEGYCRDISTKIKATFDMKRRNGDFIGNIAPYGYVKNPENHNKLLIEESSAKIVRMIFDLKIEGMNNGRIADYLNSLGIPSPMERLTNMGVTVGFAKDKEPGWSHQAVARILTNEQYIGTKVQGKSRKLSFKNKKTAHVPKEDWIRVKDAMPAIVSRRTFEYVQDLLARDTGTAPDQSHVYLFSGFARCGDCGQTMTRVQIKQHGNTSVFQVCSENRIRKTCSSHRIKEDKLARMVAASIREHIEYLSLVGEKLKNKELTPSRNLAMTSVDEKIHEALEELNYCRNAKTMAYEDRVGGILDQDGFVQITEMYTARIKKAEDQIEWLQGEKRKLIDDRVYLIPWIESVKEFRGFTELTRKMLVTMVEDIFVFEGGNVEVTFRYADQIADLLRMVLEDGEKIEVPRKMEINIDEPVPVAIIHQPTYPQVLPLWRESDLVDKNGVEISVVAMG